MWFGTKDGLNRFDGYDFRTFRNIPNDSTSLSDNNIWALYEDFQGNIWAGTQGGILNCFDPATERFKRININSDVSLKEELCRTGRAILMIKIPLVINLLPLFMQIRTAISGSAPLMDYACSIIIQSSTLSPAIIIVMKTLIHRQIILYGKYSRQIWTTTISGYVLITD